MTFFIIGAVFTRFLHKHVCCQSALLLIFMRGGRAIYYRVSSQMPASVYVEEEKMDRLFKKLKQTLRK